MGREWCSAGLVRGDAVGTPTERPYVGWVAQAFVPLTPLRGVRTLTPVGSSGAKGGTRMPIELGVSQMVLWLTTVAVIVGIPIAALALVFLLGRRSATRSPEAALRSRFARGDITQAEFDAAMSALGR
jgi:uncharacterized membrane protein